jgi:hypothetical protein
MTKGAVTAPQRKAATNVVIFQWPCGTRPTSLPRCARPRVRAMLVLVPVPSMNTSRAASSEG